MNSSRATKSRVEASRMGPPVPSHDGTSDGEEIRGTGSAYRAVLNERTNKSLNRENVPDRASANAGKVSTVSMASRMTGRVAG